MALNLNQTRFLQPLRSSKIHNSFAEAIVDIELLKGDLSGLTNSDGISVVARYMDGEKVKSVLGIFTNVNGKIGFTHFVLDSDKMDALLERVSGLETKVGENDVVITIKNLIKDLTSTVSGNSSYFSVEVSESEGKLSGLTIDATKLDEKFQKVDSAITAAESAAKAAATTIIEGTDEGKHLSLTSVKDETTSALQYTIGLTDVASAIALNAEILKAREEEGKISKALETESSDRQTQDDKIEASVGLAKDGSYINKENSNYLKDATSISNEIDKLDVQAKVNADAIDAIEEFIGLNGEDSPSVADQISNAINKLDKDQVGQSGEYIQMISEADGIISAVAKTLVDSNDKVLNFTENGITSTISVAELTTDEIAALSEENVYKAYKLVGKDGKTQLGETIKIYKDQTLKNVELVFEKPAEVEGGEAIAGQFLKYTYIISDNSEKVIYVDVSAFLTESEYGNGLKVENSIISANLGEDTATNKNYLDLEGDVEGKKKLAVRSIDADSTKLQKDIVVAGLSTQFGAGNYSNNDVITAGTDIYTILQNILCKELYPTEVGKKEASATASMSNLTLTLDNYSTIEVGTLVKLTAGKTNGSTVSKNDSTVSGMTYGYSASDDDSVDSTDTTITKTCSTSVSDNTYTISATIDKGFNADTTNYPKTTPTTVNGTGSASLTQTNLGCAVEGDNKITINATGASYSYSADEISGVYYCSNLGNTDSAKYFTGVSAVNSTTSKPTKSANITVTAKYKYFLGYSDNTVFSQFDSTSVRGLNAKTDWVTKDDTTTIVSDKPSMVSNGKSIVIACPNKYKLATINNGVGADILANFSSVGEVDVKTGEITTKYKVYVYPITNGATVEFKNVTLTKA